MAERATQNIDFAGADYLGLARDARIIEAARQAAEEYGVSATSGRWALGWTPLHDQLETRLAVFMGSEAACLLSGGYLGGPAYFETMASTHRVVVCDSQIHPNQGLGMRGAGFEIRTFRHFDMDDLERQLTSCNGAEAIVATDGVSSISGEIAPLAEISVRARNAGAALYVDDSHGFGTLGQSGRGATELPGLPSGAATVMASMSKALGCAGGFLAGSKDLMERIRKSNVSAGSTPLPPMIAAACLRALEILRAEPEHLKQLHARGTRMREILREARIEVVAPEPSPILAMLLKSETEAARLAEHFLTFGLRIPYFKYASEPRTNLLRAIARSTYTEAALERFAEALRTRPKPWE